MADQQYIDASARLKKIVQSKSAEEMDKMYSEWSSYYDKDVFVLGAVANAGVVRNTMEFLENSESTMLLDAAAGTGRCAEVLKSCNFKGIMDALEMNGDMLRLAGKKSLYRNHWQFRMTPDTSLPVDDNSYDVVLCSGSLMPGHVEPGCILPMLRALKIGGLLSFNCRQTEFCEEYNKEMNEVLEKLLSSGHIETVLLKNITHYKTTKQEVSPSQSLLHIYRKKTKLDNLYN